MKWFKDYWGERPYRLLIYLVLALIFLSPFVFKVVDEWYLKQPPGPLELTGSIVGTIILVIVLLVSYLKRNSP